MEDTNDANSSDQLTEGALAVQLRRAYLNEKHAPELLPANPSLLDALQTALAQQADRVAQLPETEQLSRCLYEMELERVTFQLREYLRARLFKISKHALHLARDEAERDKLTDHERTFLEGYLKLYQAHIDREAWSSVPEAEQLPAQIRDIALGGSKQNALLVEPELEQHVFVRARRDCGLVGRAQPMDMYDQDIVMLPYADIRALVLDGSVELI